MQGNINEAILAFKEAAIIDPDNAAVFYNLGQLSLALQNNGEALRYAQLSTRFSPVNVWYQTLLAEAFKATRQFEKAAETYIFIYDKLEKKTDYLYAASENFYLSRSYPKSIKVLDRIEKEKGLSEEVIVKKEQLYLVLDKPSKAIDEVKKLVAAYPKQLRYMGMLADLYMSIKKEGEALKIYTAILDEQPGNGFANMAMADYNKQKGNTEKWFFHFSKALSSTEVELRDKLNELVPMLNPALPAHERNQAQKLLDVLAEAHPAEATVFVLKGDQQVHEKNYNEARVNYRRALDLNPDNLMTWQQLLFCSQELKDDDTLLRDCESALEYFPAEPMFYSTLSITYIQRKEYQKAIEKIRPGIEYSADNERLKVQMLTLLGDAAQYAKLYSSSDSAYEAALAIEPDNSLVLNNYAYFLSVRKEHLDRADSMSSRTLQLQPNSASYLDTYGWILFQKKQYAEAKRYIERSLEIAPANAEVTEHLGDILFMMNDKAGALNKWKQAKELGSQSENLERKIAEQRYID